MVSISIIIPAYNEEKYIGETLKSIKNQDFKDYEIIVADCFSNDNTVKIAEKYALSPAQLALSWCAQVDGVSSTIIGATSISQLKEDVAAFEKSLSDTILNDINSVLRQYPVPF